MVKQSKDERLADALDRNTAALLTVAAMFAKTGAIDPKSIPDGTLDSIREIYRKVLTQMHSLS